MSNSKRTLLVVLLVALTWLEAVYMPALSKQAPSARASPKAKPTECLGELPAGPAGFILESRSVRGVGATAACANHEILAQSLNGAAALTDNSLRALRA